jgi:hypothetical protein
MQVGVVARVKFRVLPFREKIQGQAAMPGNDLIEGIILRAETIF